jgi:hypothetical protein
LKKAAKYKITVIARVAVYVMTSGNHSILIIHEIEKIIHSLKCKDSYGYDEISTRILKISAPYILSPLTYIFNKTLSSGIFPDRLKFSEVKPLFQKGSTIEFCNYRPISLLTSFSKVLEKNYI